jgi:hypothetical protein
MRALDPTTGAALWSDASIGGIHWESPILVNGRLYVTDEAGNLWAFEPNPPADFNADGHEDILWRNTVTGENLIWLMNGTGYGSTVSLLAAPTNWSIVGVGDFNGDGKPDILWRNTATGENLIWLMNGTSYGSSVWVLTAPTNWSVGGVGDFNGDGKPDILWRNTATGENLIWLMNGTSYGSTVWLLAAPPNWSVVGPK